MIIYEKDNLDRVIIELVFFNSGSIASKKEGVAYFLSKILNKGTLKNPENKFFDKLDSRAISISASIGKETFVISIMTLKEHLNYAIKSINELLLNPLFTDEIFNKVKKEILSIIHKKETDYDYIASNNLQKIIFKDTPLEKSNIPSLKNLEKITLKDIKKHFKLLTKQNSAFLIGGNIDNIEDIRENIFKNTPSGEKQSTPFFKTTNQDTITIKKNVEQSYIYFASDYNLKVNNKDAYKAKIASFIIGASGFGSRLMESIRVKNGLAYSAYARNVFTKSHSIFRGYLQTNIKNQQKAIELVKQEIKNFTDNGITQEELDMAKKFILGSEPLRNETLQQRLQRKFNEKYYELEDNYYTKELKLIKNISLNEMNNYILSHKEINNLSFSIVTK